MPTTTKPNDLTPTALHAVTMRRRTVDGTLVQFWTDGAITLGHEMQNRVVARGVDRRIIVLIADDVCLYADAEVKPLIKAARKALDLHVCEPHRQLYRETRRLMRVFANATPRRVRGAA